MVEILKYPDERLQQASKPVQKFDDDLHRLLDKMALTMYAAKGVGLAGAQISYFLRAFIIDIGAEDPRHRRLFEMINPRITRREGKIVWEEGCLSVPGYTERVNRAAFVTLEYFDRHGAMHSLDGEELLSVAIQHEFDHIEGVLFIDRLSPLKRRFLKRKIAKGIQL